MVASTYPSTIKHHRRDEGGYVNHPKDPGGANNFGITQSVYETFRNRSGLPIRFVKLISVSTIHRTLDAEKVAMTTSLRAWITRPSTPR